MRWYWSFAYRWSALAVVASLALFAYAVSQGFGLKSLVFPATAGVWLLMMRYERDRARAAHRHHELRARRLQRMRDGTWTGPHRDD